MGIAVVPAVLGIAGGALWQIYEWRSDAWLGTQLSEGNDDTNGDGIRDTPGSLAGVGAADPRSEHPRGGVRVMAVAQVTETPST